MSQRNRRELLLGKASSQEGARKRGRRKQKGSRDAKRLNEFNARCLIMTSKGSESAKVEGALPHSSNSSCLPGCDCVVPALNSLMKAKV